MAGNFFKYMGPLNEGEYLPRKVENLPVDAHSLLSLAAPRPVFLNGGTNDSWTDPYGMYLTTVEASPVYELLGGTGIVMNDDVPQIDVAYSEGDLGYRYHDGGHTDSLDAPAFLEFAKKYFDNNTPVIAAGQTLEIDLKHNNKHKSIGRVQATDADGDNVGNWQITGGSGAWLFEVDSDNGKIYKNKSKSWPRGAHSVTLELTASDGTTTSARETVTIELDHHHKHRNNHKKKCKKRH